MANIKKLALGVLVALFAFGFSAFKSVENRSVERWHFRLSEPLANASEVSAYDEILEDEPTCNDNPGFPCIIEFNNSNAATPDLAAYLAQFSGNDAAIAASATTKRSNQN